MVILIAIALFAAAPGDPPPAAQPTPDELLAQAKAEVQAKYVCRMETATGARLPKKVCRNKADMARKAAEDQAGLREKQMTGGLNR